jgi:cytochrome b6-f complex iron-sulfur subunit
MTDRAVQQSRGVSRREFLNYVWIASMALFMAELGGAVYVFALPRFREGEFGGMASIGTVADRLPQPDGSPAAYPDIKTWIINVGPEGASHGGGRQGLLALYKVCVHLGCLYAWVDSNHRFECPCHGSKYQLDGTYIEGPAPRDADRFVVQLVDQSGKVVAQTDSTLGSPTWGAPIPIPDNAGDLTVVVQTGDKIDLGKRHYYKPGA